MELEKGAKPHTQDKPQVHLGSGSQFAPIPHGYNGDNPLNDPNYPKDAGTIEQLLYLARKSIICTRLDAIMAKKKLPVL